jgi:uncharacterized phage protein (TIGR02218 family)
MKRLMPSSLISFLQTTPNCQKADLFSIFLPTGQNIFATEGQWDITLTPGTPGWNGPQITFYASKYGKWTRGSITSEATFAMHSNTMTLTCAPQVGVTFPGLDLGILSAIRNGLFDAAIVTVYTAYMPSAGYGDVSNGIETKWYGTITKVAAIDRVHGEFECADPFYLLNLKVPTRLIQTSCPWSFADNNCDVPGGAAAFTYNFTAKTGSTQLSLIPVTPFGGAAAADGFFTQGVVKCLTGANAGLSQSVKAYTGGTLTLPVRWLLPVVPGDTFSVIAGCDKTLSTCIRKFNNALHYGGMPFVPVPDTAL